MWQVRRDLKTKKEHFAQELALRFFYNHGCPGQLVCISTNPRETYETQTDDN